MKKVLIFLVVSLALILSACASPVGAGPPTPGSMMPDNPEAAHMMEAITAPNVQPATETTGGQPLEFREENGVKVFELTTKAVQWPILDGVTVPADTYNAPVPGRAT